MPESNRSVTDVMRSLRFDALRSRKFTGNRTATPVKIDFLQKLGYGSGVRCTPKIALE
jgi:hypothetical protein